MRKLTLNEKVTLKGLICRRLRIRVPYLDTQAATYWLFMAYGPTHDLSNYAKIILNRNTRCVPA